MERKLSEEQIVKLKSGADVSFWGNDTIHPLNEGTFFHNYQGLTQTVYESLDDVIKTFNGSDEEKAAVEKRATVYEYSSFLSKIKDAEVFLDKDGNVAFSDFENKDFTNEELAKAKTEN